MATIKFFADETEIVGGSGLGFYGNGFANSVDVGEYQATTFITNAAGTAQGPQVHNIKYQNANSGIINSATSGVWLRQVPNNLATLNINFTHDSAVQVENVEGRFYDRVSINNAQSGVTVYAAELIHPDTTQNLNGSGDIAWIECEGSTVVLDFANSPGSGGEYAGDGVGTPSSRADTWHDWYAAISCSPDSIGSKLFAFSITLEYF